MESSKEFREQGHKMIDYLADYFEKIEQYPVKSQVKPGDIIKQLPDKAPVVAESMGDIMGDFNDIILPGITHWQHPRFHAYFPANNSFPSILAEILTSGLGVQAMIWETSPAAAELEELTLNWFKEMMQLPENWHGVIQDTASTATLVALLTAREKYSKFEINQKGFTNQKFRVYCSAQAHSSIDKAVKISGIGNENLIKIPVDRNLEMDAKALENQINKDLSKGYTPLFVIVALGTTGTVAIDSLDAIGKIADKYNCWTHVDAAYAGSAMILPEFREKIKGLEWADSFVFNPHKWLFTNFDVSVYYVKDKEALINTFAILPSYLRTHTYGKVNDYRDWGIQLGRRFRALKLWFVLRSFGTDRLKEKLREHINLAKWFEIKVIDDPNFELLLPRSLNVVVFKATCSKDPDDFNEKLVAQINQSGAMYLTHTVVEEKYAIRMVIGNTRVTQTHVEQSWKQISETAKGMNN
ncbi:MAG: aspartate aminotransferase family protein [Bacteroidetes bacterium]|nr:MAG: aspartate aminotransferase family protein [Bacteroidota bacterium]